MHALIQQLVVSEYVPGIIDCKTVLQNIQKDCLMHGIGNPPYYDEMAKVIESVLMRLKKR